MGFWNNVGDFFMGSKGSRQSIYDPQQQQVLGQVNQQAMSGGRDDPRYQQLGGYFDNLYSNAPGSMDAFQGPVRQQYEQEIIPGIADRFAGQGSGNQSSSAFQNALGGAGGNLATNLAALRGQLQQQALPYALQHAQQPIDNLRGLASVGLNRSSFQDKQGSPGFLANMGGPILGAIGTGLGGPIGGAIGSGLGGIISNWFSSKPSNSLQSSQYGMTPSTGNYNPYSG